MQTLMKLAELMPQLKPKLRDAINQTIKSEGLSADAIDVKRNSTSRPVEGLNEGEKAVIQRPSTRHLDRDMEIIVPSGWKLDQFKMAPQVLIGHDYSQLPVGSDDWIIQDDMGLLAKTVYGETQLANDVWLLRRDGHLRTSSVGFVPLAHTMPGHNDWDKTMRKLEKDWPELSGKTDQVSRVITKALLLEHSEVSVPANPYALTVEVAKGRMELTEDMIKRLALPRNQGEITKALKDGKISGDDAQFLIDTLSGEVKASIPFAVHGQTSLAPEGTKWDGQRQVARADVEQLRKMCAWVDSENEEDKSAYKFPHHLAEDNLSVVWRGVSAAMGALLGARGGADIPAKDRQGVYQHLARHYKQFDKEPPELREYTAEELTKLLTPEEPQQPEPKGAVIRTSAKLISKATLIQPALISADVVRNELALRSGKV
jgi:phage head maturation protease